MRTPLMISGLLLLAACAGKPAIVMTPRAACASLIPDSWTGGFRGAPIPTTPAIPSGVSQAVIDTLFTVIKLYAAAFVEESGQREKANGRTADVIHIVRTCERLANEARPDAPTR